jgi:hypothetical protein
MVIINNLNSYDDYNNYFSIYLKNNSKLNKIIQNSKKHYINDGDELLYYRKDINNIMTRNIYENSNLIIMLNTILEQNMYAYCIKTQKKYICEKIHKGKNNNSATFPEVAYHFNCSGDEFILYFIWEYYNPIFIYYPKSNAIYNISYRPINIEAYFSKTLNKYNLLHKIDFSKTYYFENNSINYFIGLTPNAGHYFWNEVLGLMFIIENNLLESIDKIIIDKYDFLGIGSILKNKYNKTVLYNNSNNIFGVNISKHFIHDNLITIFKGFYNLCDKNKQDKDSIDIVFDLRSNSRVWLNQEIFMNNIIHKLNTNKKINFYISGVYTCKDLNKGQLTNIFNYNNEYSMQMKVFNRIQSNFSHCKIYNLIGKNLSELIFLSEKFDIIIANLGSGISFFSSLIFNTNIIGLTNNISHDSFHEQKYCFENILSNSKFIDKKYITDNTKTGDFKLNSPVLIDNLYEIINKNSL